MPKTMIRQGSLVLYKSRPALVKHIGEKLGIELEGGKSLKVRPKDITLLHPGPTQSLSELRPQAGEVEIAWEILAGNTTSLAELAELIYGAFTPATAWSVWQLVADGLYFRGLPEAVIACSPEEVTREQATREARAAEEQAWTAFLERVRQGQIAAEDSRYLGEVEELALGRRAKSRLLRELGRVQSPENAHALLIELDHWDHTINPYPRRLGLDTAPPAVELLSELPQEARVDLTHLPAFAIDDQGSQDPDDALSLEGSRLWVHVADVAALVRPDSPADQEACARGANLYLPERTVPMLPPRATQLLGLGLAEVSPALSFGLDLNHEGEIAGVEVVPSWVRVQRLSYEQVEARLDEEPFHSLYRMAQHHQARRRDNGAVFIELPEVKVRVRDEQVVIRPLPPLKSRDLVREAMLMAGQAAAHFALERNIPCPFTTQEPSEVNEQPEGLAGMFALRRSLRPRQMKGSPAPHAGLGLEVYAQATSPLRRYLDLVVHQQLRAYLRGEDLLGAQEVLERVGAAEAITGTIRQAERLANRHWTLVYLLERPGWKGEAVLVEKRGLRAKVLIPEFDLMIPMHLRQDLPLDSVIPLTLSGVNLVELEAYFLFLSG